MKLSELAEKAGIPVEQLLDQLELDGVGPVKDALARAGKSQELEQKLAQTQGQLDQYTQYVASLQGQARAEAQQTGVVPEWYNDALLAPIAADFRKLQESVAHIKDQQIATLARGMNDFMKAGYAWANKVEEREMKRTYPDFDREKIEKFAKDKSYGGDWEATYHAERSSRLPDIIKEEVRKARAESAGPPEHTEMGSGTPSVGIKEKAGDYEDAWKGLVTQFNQLGFGTH